MAGGVALNCVANSKIIIKTPIEKIWVQPASGDAGGGLGSALAFYYMHLQQKRNSPKDIMKGAYLGPEFNEKEIICAIKKFNLKSEKSETKELLKKVAEKIDNEKIVGWFQGRMEFGPRSLGNRAILGKANSFNTQKNINTNIKFRESFRPFAPSIIEEKILEYYQPLKNQNISPYMLFTFKLKEEHHLSKNNNSQKKGIELLNIKRSTLQAVTHVDFSSRVQTVSSKDNRLFYDLLTMVEQKTGVPIVVNTSFNVRGEPIVCTPEDAINCYLKTNMDILVMGNHIITKES